jgi:uncharacterized protein YyaL (SSP411 family)
MARHRIDIDQFWSDRDGEPEYKLQRRDNAFPTWHVNSQFGSSTMTANWLAGTALWHLLTGDPEARAACLRNAEGIVAVWDKIARLRPYNGPQHNMADNGWAIESLCAAYDLSGDRRWLDEALKLFDGNVTARWKAFGPHLHAPVLVSSQEYSGFDKAYCHAIAPLCILHSRTGEERVLRLLVEGCEKPFPESYFDAPMFLAGLFAYTGAVTGKAAYLERAWELFAQGFPESATPPVVMPGDSTWSATSAMRLRAGYPLPYAIWRGRQTGPHP